MRYVGSGNDYDIVELEYNDRINNSHKFYTIYMDLTQDKWFAHYGRIGTRGQMTKPKKGYRGGVKQASEKYQKGYDILRQGRASLTSPPVGGIPKTFQLTPRHIL